MEDNTKELENLEELEKQDEMLEEKNDVEESDEESKNTSSEVKEESSPKEEVNESKKKAKKKNSKRIIIILLVIIILLITIIGSYILVLQNKENKENTTIEPNVVKSEYRMSGNSLDAFDLYFLQLENNGKNKVYSPLSIKYALAMLNEGTKDNSKAQIAAIIGDYKANKYTNSANMSIANALFINNLYKDSVKESYTNTLKKKYNAEVLYDSFETPNTVNNWVSNKTFNLINNLFDNVSDKNLILLNALAIDMDWKKVIQPIGYRESYGVSYKHENFNVYVPSLDASGYASLDFNNKKVKAKSVLIAGEANKYDIVNILGEDNIRKTVGAEYEAWLEQEVCGPKDNEPDVNTYLDKYIEEINSNYKHISSSTDFKFYDDEKIKAISKELKEYNGTTLEYVGIMPKEEKLEEYIKNAKAKDISTIISNLKGIELDSFKDGVVTEIKGTIPLFKIEYELNLLEDLKSLGVTDVFDITKANLTGITKTKDLYIDSAIHKANIEFSNEGIKAAAATAMTGAGSTGCGFYYNYDVPKETIDLTFDKPYLYLIRDKETGEIWFAGTVYEPIEYQMEY